MRTIARTATVLGLVYLAQAPSLFAQSTGFDKFAWYLGAQGGMSIIETQTQTPGAFPAVGAHTLITAKRTGLLISVDEVIMTNETSSYSDPAVVGGRRTVTFNDARKFSFTLLAFPFNGSIQPYIGVGFRTTSRSPEPAWRTLVPFWMRARTVTCVSMKNRPSTVFARHLPARAFRGSSS